MASTALACGAVRVAEACRELEQAAANGGMWLAPGLIQRLHEEFNRAKAALLIYREGVVAKHRQDLNIDPGDAPRLP